MENIEILNHLAQAHPVDIEKNIIIPAINQIIDDCKDSIDNAVDDSEPTQAMLTKYLLIKNKHFREEN